MASAKVSEYADGSVQGFLHQSERPSSVGMVLTHGAGGNCEAPLLFAIATAFSSVGWSVLRCNLHFRQRRRFGPPSPKTAAEDRVGLKDAIHAIRALGCTQAFLGGHSYGGRQATILAAEEPGLTQGLLLLSYPLHPPRKPDQLRTAHFSRLQTPAFFIHGTTDPFGLIDEMTSALKLIPAPTKLVPIEGAGHDLARGKFDLERLVIADFRKFTGA